MATTQISSEEEKLLLDYGPPHVFTICSFKVEQNAILLRFGGNNNCPHFFPPDSNTDILNAEI